MPVEFFMSQAPRVLAACSGRNKSYAELLKIIERVPSFGDLNAGDLTQDLLAPEPCGILTDKASQIFDDLHTTIYVGPGAGFGCNFIFRGSRDIYPAGGGKNEKERHQTEIITLTNEWLASPCVKHVLLGRRQVSMNARIMELVLCDYYVTISA